MHPEIKKQLGYRASESEAKILKDWKVRTRNLCKPCWELKYCPYGPLVEQFPLPPTTKDEAVEHHEHLLKCLKNGKFEDGKKLDGPTKKYFQMMVKDFNKNNHPNNLPAVIANASCRVFGHLCPAFFVAEPLTETKDLRKHSRSIPRDVMLKVVRRDGQICQKCFEGVPDNLVEFDHVIPFSRGGTSTVDNIRLLCRDCNRGKSDSLEQILSPDPLRHLYKLKKKRKR